MPARMGHRDTREGSGDFAPIPRHLLALLEVSAISVISLQQIPREAGLRDATPSSSAFPQPPQDGPRGC